MVVLRVGSGVKVVKGRTGVSVISGILVVGESVGVGVSTGVEPYCFVTVGSIGMLVTSTADLQEAASTKISI